MATVSGTSALGGQRVIGYGTLSAAQFELVIPSLKSSEAKRIGYGYVMAKDNASPNNVRMLQHAPIYAPGVFYTFPNNYGFTNVQYAWWIVWNVAGLGYTITYA